jgi:hypothetical protein
MQIRRIMVLLCGGVVFMHCVTKNLITGRNVELSMATRPTEDTAIDGVFSTLYANSWLDTKVLKAEAGKRIARAIARLDKAKRKTLEDEAEYRLEQWGKFSTSTPDLRAETLRIARERHITLEQAYEIASKKTR